MNKSFLQVGREHFYLPTGNWTLLLPLKGSSERDSIAMPLLRTENCFGRQISAQSLREREEKKEKKEEYQQG